MPPYSQLQIIHQKYFQDPKGSGRIWQLLVIHLGSSLNEPNVISGCSDHELLYPKKVWWWTSWSLKPLPEHEVIMICSWRRLNDHPWRADIWRAKRGLKCPEAHHTIEHGNVERSAWSALTGPASIFQEPNGREVPSLTRKPHTRHSIRSDLPQETQRTDFLMIHWRTVTLVKH